jgi:hypothetical protein
MDVLASQVRAIITTAKARERAERGGDEGEREVLERMAMLQSNRRVLMEQTLSFMTDLGVPLVR